MAQDTEQQPKKKRRGFEPRPGHVVQAFVFALDPGVAAERKLRSHCGAARTAYNWAVSSVLASWDQRKAEETYDIGETERTPWRSWSLPSLRRAFNAAKRDDPRFCDWWEANSKEAYSTGLANASAAFDAYAKSKRGERRGPRVGRPPHPQPPPPGARAQAPPPRLAAGVPASRTGPAHRAETVEPVA
ncbi:helix-turn-helix domain-containing protein [Nocardiopsis aegyptia]|uniref:Helix-turn-helix domain-containing protein n=1 Tax=Nocardiopsis aegyptia TaxID=220378 RepID=A0A7Z0ERS5_9ACTN|nr:helix-turn-helix domain-containing protein [Nocardiopsis aegyptia]NYJ37100.1 hypothetical protein [Nocardiopsis aegyptia]